MSTEHTHTRTVTQQHSEAQQRDTYLTAFNKLDRNASSDCIASVSVGRFGTDSSQHADDNKLDTAPAKRNTTVA